MNRNNQGVNQRLRQVGPGNNQPASSGLNRVKSDVGNLGVNP